MDESLERVYERFCSDVEQGRYKEAYDFVMSDSGWCWRIVEAYGAQKFEQLSAFGERTLGQRRIAQLDDVVFESVKIASRRHALREELKKNESTLSVSEIRRLRRIKAGLEEYSRGLDSCRPTQEDLHKEIDSGRR